MPITKQAKKALRVADRKRVFNLRRTRAMKDVVKEVKTLAKTNASNAKEKLSSAYKAIDKAAKKGIIKKNTAARKKSRLSRLISKAK